MGKDSNIEWCDHTWNPWWGCSKVSAGCANCYAETLSARFDGKGTLWGPNSKRKFFGDKHWNEPLKWDKAAEKAGERHRVFCASMADVFEDREDLDEHRIRLFNLIQETPNLDWLLLTKRPDKVLPFLHRCRLNTRQDDSRFVFDKWIDGFPPLNVWLGTSVENQEAADKRIPELLSVPAKVRFLSCEPLLGRIDITQWAPKGQNQCRYFQCKCAECGYIASSYHMINVDYFGESDDSPCPKCNGEGNPHLPIDAGIHWVIAGGESGPNARPMHPDWARSLRDQCVDAGVAFHFKQWGEYADFDNPYDVCSNPRYKSGDMPQVFVNGKAMNKVGKKAAGRLLDGRTWDEFPKVNL